jgi:hypothetical protein
MKTLACHLATLVLLFSRPRLAIVLTAHALEEIDGAFAKVDE